MASSLWIGTTAALLAALLGSAWQLLTRHGVTTTLGPIDLALLRYGLPALALLPVLRRTGLRPRTVSWRCLAVLVGGGLPFGLLVLAGAQFAPAAHMAVFVTGAVPVFTALACLLLRQEQIPPLRWLGLACMMAGVAWLGLAGTAQAPGAWRGDLLFLLAAMAWAGYTLAFRRSGLTPWEAGAVINTWSCIGLLLVLPWVGELRLFTAPWKDILAQAAGQGVLAGLLGITVYMTAIAHLGSSRAALSSALVPPMTALGAAILLGEPADASTWWASLLVACGIVVASGVRWRLVRGPLGA